MRPIKNQRGQTLIIALVVTLVLAILGFVFVAIIGHNFFQTQRFGEIIDVQYYSEAGINYGVHQLVYSEEGADWRPTPATLLGKPFRSGDMTTATAAQIQAFTNDPDYEFLKRYDSSDGQGGYSRINFDRGRALVRITYNPQLNTPISPIADPNSKFIKVESIGKVGRIDAADPTLFVPGNKQPKRELIAYVQIGLTDYARFVTNLNHKTLPAEVGIPIAVSPPTLNPGQTKVTLGVTFIDKQGGSNAVQVPQIYGNPQIGASIRVNGDVKFYGDVKIYTNAANKDGVFVSGRIYKEPGSQQIIKSNSPFDITPSLPTLDFPKFYTQQGAVRDGSALAGADGYPRGITYLEPPLMDQNDPVNGNQRYRTMTRDSGFILNGVNTGRLGYGRGVYVDNTGDVQKDSNSLFGGYSLRADMLHTDTDTNSGGDQTVGYWNGPYYEPPGATLEFFYDENPASPVNKRAGFRITRNSRSSRDVWRALNGRPTQNHTMVFYFRDSETSTNRSFYNLLTENEPGLIANEPFNGTLYFEGNVRVRGRIPKGRQFTVVSAGSIYIEGNLLKTSETSTCALLAHDYVVLNTTQFFKPGFENAPRWVKESPDSPTEVTHARITSDPFSDLPITYSIGDIKDTQLFVFISHAGSGFGSYTNMLVNNQPYLFTATRSTSYQYGNAQYVPTLALEGAHDLFPSFQHTAYPIIPVPNGATYSFNSTVGLDNQLLLQLDSRIVSQAGKQPYFVSKVAVAPMTIHIDALIYAQTGSFFVIPGPWFNENSEDRKDRMFADTGGAGDLLAWRRDNFNVVVNPGGPDFPYYGEPLPIRIELNGAITENFPPPMSDQSIWLRHWGWMPNGFGLSTVSLPTYFTTPSPAPGFDSSSKYLPNLFINYDPVFATGRPTNSFTFIRTDDYGRPLPAAPKLPVCPNVIYSGEAQL